MSGGRSLLRRAIMMNNVKKKPSAGSIVSARSAPAPAAVGRLLADWARMPERRVGPRMTAGPDFQEEVKRALLGRYTPAAVLIDDSFHVVHVHGHVSPFLESTAAAPTANLMKMAKGELAIGIRAAVMKAKSEDRPVSKTVLHPVGGRPSGLTIDVIAVRSSGDRRRGYLIVFKSEARSPTAPPADGACRQLEFDARCPEADVPENRCRILTGAEKLRLVNEELASAKEELQATNAELLAVNLELRKGNSNLNATNDDLSNLLASSQIPILMLDRKMRIRRFTPPAEKAFGLLAASVGQPLASLRLNIEAPLLKDTVRNVIAGFDAAQMEVHDHQDRWYSLWVRPYKTAANVIDGAVLSMTDITEKRAGIRALEASRDYAEAIVDTVNDSLLILNRHLKVKSASRFYYELFQETPAEVKGRSIYELGKGRWNVPPLRKHLSALATHETPFSGWEAEFDVPKLGRRTLTVSGRVVPHDPDSETKIVVAIEDVSLRKQAAEAAALRKSEARQRDFVANVSHELMTPITAIKGYSESLIGGALEIPGRRVKFTQIIEKHAERLSQLVEDLLQLSRYDAGSDRGAPENVLLRAKIERQVRGLAPVARGRGVSIRVLVPKNLRVEMNRAELSQVMQNLCENAIKYNRKKGSVFIRARRIGKRVVVSVQDTGIGIPKEDLPRIFDRFHRAENARLKTARGNGLGLSIVRSILANRGCRVWAESAEGKGTTISFTLPCALNPRRRTARGKPARRHKPRAKA
ncbi:MAG: ATP-binding protein [Elusimicrobiota bacterium]